MMRRDDEIRLGGRLSRFGHGSREDRRLSLREREAEYEDEEEEEEDEDLDEDEEDDEDDEEDDGDEEEDEDDSDEEDDDDEDDRGDDDEDSDEPSPAPSEPVSGSDNRDAFIAAYLAEKERELALEREAAERAEKEEREREEQARLQAEEEERARRVEKAEIARRAREAEDRAGRAEDRLGRTRTPFNGTESRRGRGDSLDELPPVSGHSGGSQRESYAGREPVLSESDRALRERELALKEREIALKERELALREREQQLKSTGGHSGKGSNSERVAPASYTTRVINGKTVKVKDTSKKVSRPIEEPVALSQDNRSKRYEGLSDESLMKEVTAFMLRYGVKKHGIPYELMAEEFGAGLIAKLIIRGHLVRLGDSTLTCGNN